MISVIRGGRNKRNGKITEVIGETRLRRYGHVLEVDGEERLRRTGEELVGGRGFTFSSPGPNVFS
mgnify:CR=1 FL=1